MTDVKIDDKTQEAIDDALDPQALARKTTSHRIETSYKRQSVVFAIAIALQVALLGFFAWLGIVFSFPGGVAVMAVVALSAIWLMQLYEKKSTLFMVECFNAFEDDVKYFEKENKIKDENIDALGLSLAKKTNEINEAKKLAESHRQHITRLTKENTEMNLKMVEMGKKKKVAPKKKVTKK